jgi:RNA polymerase subunit RPABC4/transcription elongation factor Spt4
MSHLRAKLSETAPVWGKLVTPWAEYVARTLWSRTNQRSRRPSTALTQQHRREAKGRPSFPRIEAPTPDRLCRGCGKIIERRNTTCGECAKAEATGRLASAAKLGRIAARSPEARAKHVASHLRHTKANSAWDASKQPAWLTDQLFSKKIQPLLTQASPSAIAKRLGVSRWYAGRIGRVIGHI